MLQNQIHAFMGNISNIVLSFAKDTKFPTDLYIHEETG
jgi:hypothetical protein